MNLKDIFLILISTGVDLQINSRTIREELSLLQKIAREIKRKCTRNQKAKYREYFNTLREIRREIEDFLKQKEENVGKYIDQLEGELLDMKEIDELEKNLENYQDWKNKIMLEKKQKIYNLTKNLNEKIPKKVEE